MKKVMKVVDKSLLTITCAMLLGYGSTALAVTTSDLYDPNYSFSISQKTVSDLEESFLRSVRLLEEKQALEILQSQNPDARRTDTQTPDGQSSSLVISNIVSSTQEAVAIYQWFLQNQAASPLGLVESYPDDPTLNNQAFTYDQALAGIVMLKQSDTVGAKKILDFYLSQWDGTGFWTAYNTQAADGNKIEFLKIMGPNAWVGIFSLYYYDQTGDADGLMLATVIGRWIAGLPHQNGGVAMGVDNPFGSPNWGAIFSVENNLDYYALLGGLSREAEDPQDRLFFQQEQSNLKSWFQNESYDASRGLFRRGVNDTFQSFDTNTWSILVFGALALQSDFGINVDVLVANAENTFAVQPNGIFGGAALSAKGFDFSDSVNASLIQRTGLNWAEGTFHMISVYKFLADYYSSGAAQDAAKAQYYQTRADTFASANEAVAVSESGTLAYLYTDQPGAQVFFDNPFWKVAAGRSVASTAWSYFSMNAVNPFGLFGNGTTQTPFVTTYATDPFKPGSLTIDVDSERNASVTWQERREEGIFDDLTRTLLLEDIQNTPSVVSEQWLFSFDQAPANQDPPFLLSSFEQDLQRAEGGSYDYSYFFSPDGLLESKSFEQSLNGHELFEMTSYNYADFSGETLVSSSVSTTLFEAQYGYGQMFDYLYNPDGSILSITVTQETRNDPLFRVLESYRYVYSDSGAELVFLDKQIIPLT